MSDKAVITCSLNGVLTDPKQHHVPVTPEQMAREAKAAFDAGASVMHIHLRQQAPGKGHLPSWEVAVSREIQQAIREACPGVIINHTTGTSGPNYQGALDCVRETRPEMAACNAGSLNYLKVKADNTWAWPPMMFDNAVEKVQDYLDVMKVANTIPEFECFDVGIVRCVGMYRQTGMYSGPLEYNFVMGVASGMPADPELLPILLKLKLPEAHWQVTAIGRAEIWPLHQRCADLGGHLRTGLEDTFYLGDGTKVTSNGQLIEGIADLCAQCRPRDRQPGGSAADFRDWATLMLSFRGTRSVNHRGAIAHRGISRFRVRHFVSPRNDDDQKQEGLVRTSCHQLAAAFHRACPCRSQHAVDGPGRHCPGLSVQACHVDHSLASRRRHRHCDARHRRCCVQASRPADRDRQQARRQRRGRPRDHGRIGQAGRLHHLADPDHVFRLPLMQQTSWDPEKDFSYIVHLTGYTFGVTTNVDTPFKKWQDVIDYAKANPGKVTYATPGAATSLHIGMEQIAAKAGVKFTQVPFKGNAESNTAVLGNHTMLQADGTGWKPLVDAGKLRLLMIWTAERSKNWPGCADHEGTRLSLRVRFAVRHRRSEGDGPEGRRQAA